MDPEKHAAGDSSPDTEPVVDGKDHIDTIEHGRRLNINDPSYVDHRETDDRDDTAKGRNAEKFEKKYWLSVNYIGTLFAIGMAFMGGIGGKRLQHLHDLRDTLLALESTQPPQSEWARLGRMLTFFLGYGLIAPVLSDINADIGPSPNINWVPLVNLAGGAVFFLMVGQLSGSYFCI